MASGGVEGDGGRGGQLGEVRGPGGFDFEEVGEFAGAMEGAVEEAFEGVAGDMRGEVVDGLLEGGGQLRFVGPDIEHAGGKSLVGERVFEGFGVGDVAAGGVEEPCAGFELAEESAVGEMVRGEGTGGGEGHVEGQDVGFGQDGFEGEVFRGLSLQGARQDLTHGEMDFLPKLVVLIFTYLIQIKKSAVYGKLKEIKKVNVYATVPS